MSNIAGETGASFIVPLPTQPYPGLRPFEKAEWPIFFGRERMTDAIVSLVLTKQLLVIHGDSGCGKSSLIRAGVLPRLEHESALGGVRWRTCVAVPQEAPLWNLAEALAELSEEDQREQHIIEYRRVLNYGRSGPAELARLLNTGPDNRVCILIDQFEELFEYTHRHGPEEAQLLTEFLVSLLESQPEGLYAILTMRSEFLGACARFEGFAETVNTAQYLLPRMGHEDLMRAICEPAQMFNGEITKALADRLVADTKGSQDQLPLIQHALMVLCREQDEIRAALDDKQPSDRATWKLDVENYQEKGGIDTLLSSHADSVKAEAEREYLQPGSRVVEDVFRALTAMNAEGKAIRRPCTLETLIKVTGVDETRLRGVIDHFRAEGTSFLRPYGTHPIALNDLIDVSHEALIRCWSKIADSVEGWVTREFRTGQVWRSLLVQADSYEKDNRNVLSSIAIGGRERWMQRRNSAWAERYGGGWSRVQELIAASMAARDREVAQEAAERDRQEELQRQEYQLGAQRARFRILIVFALAIAAVSILALKQWHDAEQARETAEAESESAKKALKEAKTQFSLANAARDRTEVLTQSNQQSAQSLREVQDSLEKLQREVKDSNSTFGLAETLDKANAQLGNEVSILDKSGSIAEPPQIFTKTLSPRVYIQISDERQRSTALALGLEISSLQLASLPVMVPGIELVEAVPRVTELRCFQEADCEVGQLLVRDINELFVRPAVNLKNLSKDYGASENIRPGHYELWLAPGEIALKGP